jgi:hypothetical protein
VRGEGVPQDVPADPAQASPLASPPDGVLALVLLQAPALVGAEDQVTTEVTLGLERFQGVVAERDLPVASALRGTDMAAPDVAAHDEPPGDEVDVIPLQGSQFPAAQAGPDGEREHRPPFVVSRHEEALGLLEVEEIERRLRPSHPVVGQNPIAVG